MTQDNAKEMARQARIHGACVKADFAKDWQSLANLLYSPQGREFCLNKQFPTLDIWRSLSKGSDLREYGVYIDCGGVFVAGCGNYCFVGKTSAECVFASPKQTCKVIAMHGAKVSIKASEYSVVNVCIVGDCEVKVRKDDTSIVAYEK